MRSPVPRVPRNVGQDISQRRHRPLLEQPVHLVRRSSGGTPRRGLAIALALLGGVVGFAFAVGSKNHALGKYCGIEGRNQAYTLTVRIFGTVLHEETGPAVQQGEPGKSVVGPSRELDTAMAWWELGLDTGLVAAGALVGATVGAVFGRPTGQRRSGNPA